MSDTILGGDLTVFYQSETRQKRISWTGSATGTRTVNQVYSALADLFDDLLQMDDGVPMSAQTPTQYTLGIIDPSDPEPWFIDRTTVEHLTGGALTTASWGRVTTSKTGIVRVPYTIGTDFISSDIGKTVTNATSTSSGTLLDFNTTGATKYMWIRPTNNTSTHDWGGSIGTVTVTGGSAASVTQSSPSATGDSLWANVFSLGTIVTPGTHLYLYQGTTRVGSYKSSANDWWVDGQIDILLPIKELGNFIDGAPTFAAPTTSTATSGGTLTAGTYFYRVSAYNAQGETLATAEVSQVTTGATSTVTVTPPALPTGAVGFRYYGRTTGAELFMNQVIGSVAFTDLGSNPTVPAGALPTKDTSGGYVTVFARQYTTTYSDFFANISTGGRNPIPLATGTDLNNTTGFREFTGSSGTGTFVVNETIYAPGGGALSAATKAAIVTKVAGTGAAPILDYYLIVAPGTGLLTDFVNTDAVKGNTSAATCTAAAPVNVGPTTTPGSTMTIAYGADVTFDVPVSGTNQNYSIVVDLKSTISVAVGYEQTKYTTRFGETGTSLTPIAGQSYIGEDYLIKYTTLTGAIAVGDVVFQTNSGAVGTVVANNSAPVGAASKYLIVRNHVGTFNNVDNVLKDSSNFIATPVSSALTPIHAAPFGTFAGGTWFCAPGVVLKNRLAADANKYQVVDDTGVVRKEPTSVTITVSNTRASDAISVFRLTAAGSGVINKTQMTATVQAIGATTAVVSAGIINDVIGKTTGGILYLVQGQTEFRVRFSSWAASTFTLASQTGLAATAGTTSTALFDTSVNFTTLGILVGDEIRNITRGTIGYVTAVVSATQLTTTTMAGSVSGDSFEINTLPVATTGADTWYSPPVDVSETTGTDVSPGTQTRSQVYVVDLPVLIRTRHNTSGDAANILPFETTGTITTAGLSVSIIRTKDTIAT